MSVNGCVKYVPMGVLKERKRVLSNMYPSRGQEERV